MLLKTVSLTETVRIFELQAVPNYITYKPSLKKFKYTASNYNETLVD